MRFTDIILQAAAIAVVNAGVIPLTSEQLESGSALARSQSELDSDNSDVGYQLPESVSTYANNWGDNYLTYKYHSLMHRPEASDAEVVKEGDSDEVAGNDEDVESTPEEEEASVNSVSELDDSDPDEVESVEDIEQVDEDTQRVEGEVEYLKVKRDVVTPTEKGTEVPIIDEVKSTSLLNDTLTRNSTLNLNATSKGNCIAPLDTGSKRLDINGTLNGPPKTNDTFGNKTYENEAVMRPVSCAMLGITVALAWCTSML